MFHHLSVYGKDFSLKDINGKITLNEEMNIYKDGNVSFNYLLKTNPFQRVDFSRIEPYLTTQEKLSIQKIKVKNITAGPLQAVVPIEQNVIRLQQFDMKLFGGNVAGQLYLDTTPKDWKFGVLMRVSRVDLRELLQDKNKFKASLVSARVALEFSFAKRLLQGQIDITKISQSQLLQLLEIMDPQHKEAQLNKVRELLRYAYPKAVSIDMESGLLNLSISLSVLDNPIVIRGLPLSPLIERFSFDALQKIDKLPLTKEQK
ncbi:hypothetical protein MNB_SM-3-191 [hydrothermal vent metagenome]|uniref:AsmA-like C-terminal domain-containing protein n=1 Tax=hydrothermal vent metagenome TaxID=652676 RepID=A0A1W1D333_9ZZZZ